MNSCNTHEMLWMDQWLAREMGQGEITKTDSSDAAAMYFVYSGGFHECMHVLMVLGNKYTYIRTQVKPAIQIKDNGLYQGQFLGYKL